LKFPKQISLIGWEGMMLEANGCFIGGYRFQKQEFWKRDFSKTSLTPFPVYWKPWDHEEGQLGLRK
jgi:hypothetical protein